MGESISTIFNGIVRNGSDHLLFSCLSLSVYFVYNRSTANCIDRCSFVCVCMCTMYVRCRILVDLTDGSSISQPPIVELFALAILEVTSEFRSNKIDFGISTENNEKRIERCDFEHGKQWWPRNDTRGNGSA